VARRALGRVRTGLVALTVECLHVALWIAGVVAVAVAWRLLEGVIAG